MKTGDDNGSALPRRVQDGERALEAMGLATISQEVSAG